MFFQWNLIALQKNIYNEFYFSKRWNNRSYENNCEWLRFVEYRFKRRKHATVVKLFVHEGFTASWLVCKNIWWEATQWFPPVTGQFVLCNRLMILACYFNPYKKMYLGLVFGLGFGLSWNLLQNSCSLQKAPLLH